MNRRTIIHKVLSWFASLVIGFGCLPAAAESGSFTDHLLGLRGEWRTAGKAAKATVVPHPVLEQRWLKTRPIPCSKGETIDFPWFNEAEFPGAPPAGANPWQWEYTEAISDGIWSDLHSHKSHVSYYVRLIETKTAGTATCHFGITVPCKLWLNNRLLEVPAKPGERTEIKLALTPGKNLLALKIYNPAETMARVYYGLDDRASTREDDAASEIWKSYPQEADWFLQDCAATLADGMANWKDGHDDGNGLYKRYLAPDRDPAMEIAMIRKVAAELPSANAKEAIAKLQILIDGNLGADDRRWLELYLQLCRQRRQNRLAPLLAKTNEVVFAKHNTFGAFIYLNTEYSGDNGPTGLFSVKLDVAAPRPIPELLFDPGEGIVRDPDLHWDGQKLLFAWRKSKKAVPVGVEKLDAPGYQIHEIDLASKQRRQLTDETTYGSSFEAIYLPNDDILFSSSRIIQSITCGFGDCSNFYLMNRDGKYARRVGFDQTNTGLPAVLEDGRIVYTRRDYNDRGQVFTHALFQMNQDGTGQQEYYGNNTRDPKSFQFARSLPGSDKILCVTGGYHTCQGGKLVVMDVRKGRQGFSGICAVPSGKPLEIKKALGENFSQEGDLYQSPYPVTADGFLISYSPLGGHLFPDGVIHTHRIEPRVRYNLYWMTLDGRRELLAADPDTSCLQGVPLMKRKRPQSRASTVDYRKPSGTLFVQDVYYGLGLKGIAPGTVKKLRVVEIAYKPCTIGGVMAKGGKGGSGHSVTPPAQASGTYDVKIIHGDTEVYADGSAWVNVPARKPLYLQALDDKNRVIQTMRSWLTLMPNENFSCSGCHEDKNSPPLPASRVSIAMQHGPVDLKPFYGPPRGFSFTAEIQPILDRHCVRCHHPEGKNKSFLLDRAILRDSTEEKGSGGGNARRLWLRSYGTLTEIDLKNQYMNYRDHSKWLAWFGRLDEPDLLPPGRTGSAKARLLPFLEKGHNQVRLSTEELDKLAAWMDLGIPFCGDYFEANDWDSGQLKHYEMRMALRQKMAAIEQANIKEWILREPSPTAR